MVDLEFLSEENRELLKGYELHQQCSLLALTSQEFLEKYDKPKSKKGVSTWLYAEMSALSGIDQLSLIRGLCDRIEVKLMEQAK
jgi:hypothetical protein